MVTKICTKFNTKCSKCKKNLQVVIPSKLNEGESMIIFICSKCNTANFLDSEKILNTR